MAEVFMGEYEGKGNPFANPAGKRAGMMVREEDRERDSSSAFVFLDRVLKTLAVTDTAISELRSKLADVRADEGPAIAEADEDAPYAPTALTRAIQRVQNEADNNLRSLRELLAEVQI